jgi:hypothetical protein
MPVAWLELRQLVFFVQPSLFKWIELFWHGSVGSECCRPIRQIETGRPKSTGKRGRVGCRNTAPWAKESQGAPRTYMIIIIIIIIIIMIIIIIIITVVVVFFLVL